MNIVITTSRPAILLPATGRFRNIARTEALMALCVVRYGSQPAQFSPKMILPWSLP